MRLSPHTFNAIQQFLCNLFIVNLAVADLGVSVVVNLASVAGSITSEEGIFIKYEWLCEVIAVVCIVTCSCSLWSIAAIAFNRYVWICHWQRYRKIFNRRTVPMMIVGLWIIGFLIDLPNILGWGTHTFDWKVMSCTGGMSFVYSYAIYFAMTAFAVPLMIITFSYIGIFRFARKATIALERVRNKDGVQNKNGKGKGGRAARPADLRLARSVLAIVIIYLLMWSPYSLTVLIDHRVVYDRKLYILSYTLAHTNSSFNCVIYGATNQQFRRGYMHFIRLLFCRAKKVDLLASVTGTVGTGTLRNNRVHPAEQTSPATQESAVH
ncbi:melatonin receptor type 1A-like [Lytechinus variegatus]|uniref:melatonin receptor type 1A-like n=1 Tax=Lytechinus variegatus TaxID=7654 RepID=UPI001BB25551|nr:melatonin receptor type 1A-like [Lytechinus variegatus]